MLWWRQLNFMIINGDHTCVILVGKQIQMHLHQILIPHLGWMVMASPFGCVVFKSCRKTRKITLNAIALDQGKTLLPPDVDAAIIVLVRGNEVQLDGSVPRLIRSFKNLEGLIHQDMMQT